MQMKNIRITEDCIVNGQHTPAGTLLENVAEGLAAELITSGRAKHEPKRAIKIEARDPAPVNRDPQPAAAEKSKETGKLAKTKRPAKAG